jgi:hypothetical protein
MEHILAKRECFVNSKTQIQLIRVLGFNESMKTVDEIRRENLRILAREYGSVKSLAEKLERTEGQVSGWATGAKDSKTKKRRGINNDSARDIEEKAEKETGWLDNDHSRRPRLPEHHAQLLAIFDQLCKEQQGALMERARVLLEEKASLPQTKSGRHSIAS